jgi:alpha-D-glucose phosphate-specific phosphoglucomutase
MAESISPLAGKPVTQAMLVNVPRLVTAYFAQKPDPSIVSEKVSFGTSGHRGSAFERGFNEGHILAISQAVCLYRKKAGIEGPLFLGMDTHALSEPAFATALEVLAANGVDTMIDEHGGYTPTPGSRTALSSVLRTIRRTRAASNIIQQMAARRISISRDGLKKRQMKSLPIISSTSAAFPINAPAGHLTFTRVTTSRLMSTISKMSLIWMLSVRRT